MWSTLDQKQRCNLLGSFSWFYGSCLKELNTFNYFYKFIHLHISEKFCSLHNQFLFFIFLAKLLLAGPFGENLWNECTLIRLFMYFFYSLYFMYFYLCIYFTYYVRILLHFRTEFVFILQIMLTYIV